MAKAPKDMAAKPTRNRPKAQKVEKTTAPAEEALSEEELKKVGGGAIYMHGTGGGAG